MVAIQILLIVAAAAFGAYVFTNMQSQKSRAWKRIVLFLLIIFMVVAILFPDTTTELARMVGVGRGADLLLYGLAIAFIFFVFNVYVKFQQQRNQLNKLARQIAIADAELRYKK